jgi:hypothetical protein
LRTYLLARISHHFQFRATSESSPELTTLAAGADMAYSVGSVANVFEGEQGRMAFAGKYLQVWERREGQWWVVVYAVSSLHAAKVEQAGPRIRFMIKSAVG